MLLVLNSFMKVDDKVEKVESSMNRFLTGHVLRPYNKIGTHVPLMGTDSSEAIFPILPKIELAARWKERLASIGVTDGTFGPKKCTQGI